MAAVLRKDEESLRARQLETVLDLFAGASLAPRRELAQRIREMLGSLRGLAAGNVIEAGTTGDSGRRLPEVVSILEPVGDRFPRLAPMHGKVTGQPPWHRDAGMGR